MPDDLGAHLQPAVGLIGVAHLDRRAGRQIGRRLHDARADLDARVGPFAFAFDDADHDLPLPETNAKVGYGHFGKHGMLGYRIASGDVITVDNKKYAEAISMAPGHFTYSTVTYRLDGTAKVFRSAIAVNDLDQRNELGPATPLTFKVLGDGALLWRSQPVTKVATTQQFRLNVAGVTTLELQVHCPGRYNNARAVWLDPCVLK